MTIPTFPVLSGLTYPVKKMPVWTTDVQRTVSGRRVALARYSYPYYQFELVYAFLRADTTNKEWQTLIAFYNSVNGRAGLFNFSDPDDNSVTAQSIGTGDGTTTQFQLLRTITGTGASWNDPVFSTNGAPTIYDNATPVAGGNYSITNGVVTFNSAPVAGHALTWTGSFYWMCRFDDDSASFEEFAKNFWELKSVKFSSEKQP